MYVFDERAGSNLDHVVSVLLAREFDDGRHGSQTRADSV